MGARLGGRGALGESGTSQLPALLFDFDFCLSSSTHFWTTSTDEVAWPQGDQFLGEDL